METSNTSSSRIVKNTIILYGRMLLMMIIGFFTSRIVLQSLGVTDYGILNVVAGLITMFTMVSDTFSITIGRFITYNLGKGDLQKLKTIFSTSVNIQIILSVFIIILMETIGLWFLETKLVIPEERMFAARCVYQFSILSFVVGLISVPYNSEIISHEKMNVFAYFSLFEAFAMLLIAVLILYSPYDKLIIYSILLFFVSVIKRLFYGYYCTKHFPESRYIFILDKQTMIEMSKFSGWNFLSSGAVVLRVQGTNIMLNLFFGPTMNAAKGIANQLNNLLNGFVSNFMTAMNPQITKNYAINNLDYMKKLAFQGAKFSYFIFLFCSVPILCDTHYVLHLWLKKVPEHAVLFVQLIVIYTLLDTLSRTLRTAIYATGKIMRFQLYVTVLEILNLPISYFFLIKGAIPEIVSVINIVMAQFCLLAMLVLASDLLGFSIKEFFKDIYLKTMIVSIFAFIPPIIAVFFFPESLFRFIVICILSIIFTGISIYFIGCNNAEKEFIKQKMTTLKNKIC